MENIKKKKTSLGSQSFLPSCNNPRDAWRCLSLQTFANKCVDKIFLSRCKTKTIKRVKTVRKGTCVRIGDDMHCMALKLIIMKAM